MLIFIDYRSSQTAKNNLSGSGKVIEFKSNEIVDNYINGHPDLFLCQTSEKLIIAPNIPQIFIDKLIQNKINFHVGKTDVTKDYPGCASYNCVVNENFLIHKKGITDPEILNFSKKILNVNQGMTRCSTICIDSENYITSDKGIYKSLSSDKLNVCLVNPEEIILPGKKYGLIGGTAGIFGNKIFFNGSLKHFTEGNKIKSFLQNLNKTIIELDDSPLFDGGGIFFVE